MRVVGDAQHRVHVVPLVVRRPARPGASPAIGRYSVEARRSRFPPASGRSTRRAFDRPILERNET